MSNRGKQHTGKKPTTPKEKLLFKKITLFTIYNYILECDVLTKTDYKSLKIFEAGSLQQDVRLVNLHSSCKQKPEVEAFISFVRYPTPNWQINLLEQRLKVSFSFSPKKNYTNSKIKDARDHYHKCFPRHASQLK